MGGCLGIRQRQSYARSWGCSVALSVKTGRFAIGTSTGDVTSPSLGFAPKAVILQMTWATAADTYTNGVSRCIGFLTERGGSKQVKCVAEQMENAQGTADTDHGHRTDACLISMSIAGAIDGVAGAPAGTMFGSDTFTINVSDAFPSSYQVEYLALGGSDITDAYVDHKEYDGGTYTGDWALPGGFGQPQLCFFCTTGSGMDAASTVDVHAKLGFGVAKDGTERACVYHVDSNAATNMDGGTFLKQRAIAGPRSTTSATHEFELDLNPGAYPTDGIEFTASLGGTGTQNDSVIFGLFLRGTFQSKIALTDAPTSNTTQDLDAGFTPKLSGFFTDSRAAHSALNTTDADGFSLGWFDGTNQVAVTHSDNDGNTTSTTRSMNDDGRCIVMEDAGSAANPTLIGTAVGSYPGGNTVRLTWTNTTATARQFAWWAMGDAAVAAATSLLWPNPPIYQNVYVR